MGLVAKNLAAIVEESTNFLLPHYHPSGITPSGYCCYRQEDHPRDDRFEDAVDKTTPGKEKLQVLMAQLLCVPSNKSAIPECAGTQPAASRPRTVIMQKGMRSLFSRIVGFIRRRNGVTGWPASSAAGRLAMGPIAIIGLVTSDEDRRLLAEICGRNGWRLLFAGTCETARAALDKLKVPVILCDRDFPGKGWRETVESLSSSPHRPCTILVSGVVDTYLWDEVVRTGGYDVLSKPLREEDVVRAVRLAWSYWNSAAGRAAF